MNDPLSNVNRFLDEYLTPACKYILLINVIVFLIMTILDLIGIHLTGYLVLYSRPLAFTLMFPWGVVTYMFLHAGLLHLFFNMLGLWMIGPSLENRWGTKRFWQFYLITGIGAGILKVLITQVFPVEPGPVLGASGAIYGLMLAFAAYNPNATFYLYFALPVPAKVMVGILAALAVFGVLSGSSGVSHMTHLLGFVVAYLWLARYHKDWDYTTWRWR